MRYKAPNPSNFETPQMNDAPSSLFIWPPLEVRALKLLAQFWCCPSCLAKSLSASQACFRNFVCVFNPEVLHTSLSFYISKAKGTQGFPPTRPVLYKMLSELIRSHPEWLPRVQNLSFHFQHEHAIALQTPYSSNHIFLGPNLTERSINGDAAFYRFRPSLCFEKEGYCKAATTGILVEYAMPNMVAIREARVLPPQVIDAILYVPPLIYDLFPKRSGRDPAMPITTWRPYTLTGRHGRNRRSKLLKRFKKHNISTQNPSHRLWNVFFVAVLLFYCFTVLLFYCFTSMPAAYKKLKGRSSGTCSWSRILGFKVFKATPGQRFERSPFETLKKKDVTSNIPT